MERHYRDGSPDWQRNTVLKENAGRRRRGHKRLLLFRGERDVLICGRPDVPLNLLIVCAWRAVEQQTDLVDVFEGRGREVVSVSI